MARLGYPHPYWWESYDKGTRSLLWQDVSKNCLALCAGLVKGNGSNKHRPWHNVVLPKQVSKLDLWKYCSLYGGMWNLFCRVGHYPCIQILLWCIRRRNPPCNAEDNTARRTHRHGSLVQGLLRESWIRGYLDSRTVFNVRTIEAWRYKTQDFGPCLDGTLLCVEDKLGNPDIIFPSL